MKIAFFTLLFAILALTAFAATSQRSVIVSYPNETPDSVLDEAKKAITSAGGMITHEYKLIKAFAAKANAQAVDKVQTLGAKYNALVEDDNLVHAQGNAF